NGWQVPPRSAGKPELRSVTGVSGAAQADPPTASQAFDRPTLPQDFRPAQASRASPCGSRRSKPPPSFGGLVKKELEYLILRWGAPSSLPARRPDTGTAQGQAAGRQAITCGCRPRGGRRRAARPG